jgi:hypothetical protein
MLGAEQLNVWFWGLKITEALVRLISYTTHVLWRGRLLGKWTTRFRLHREIDKAGKKGEKKKDEEGESRKEEIRQEREQDKREESRRDTEEQPGRNEGERNRPWRNKNN